jgi:hypothetical protein
MSQQAAMTMPVLVAHADWGSAAAKRWMTVAARGPNGRFGVAAPEPVGDPATLLARLAARRPAGPIFVGFDFPIGLPRLYAPLIDGGGFVGVLPLLGRGIWSRFYDVAARPRDIGRFRPFYPQRPGRAKLRHLLAGLGVADIGGIRRACDQATALRRAPAPLFWTMGAQQVGKAAIAGWREVLAPALADAALDVAIWPFAGELSSLFRPGRIVIAETYPAEIYGHLGVRFARSPPGARGGKRDRAARQANAGVLLRWAKAAGVRLMPALRGEIIDGFGTSSDGEDRFDSTVGVFGMLNIVLGHRDARVPDDPLVRRLEGWILGHAL